MLFGFVEKKTQEVPDLISEFFKVSGRYFTSPYQESETHIRIRIELK